jgi:integrase
MGDRAVSFIDDDRLAIVEQLVVWCDARDRSMLELAISWHTSHPRVASVIAGATTPEQIAGNVPAAGWQMTAADRAEVDAILARAEYVGGVSLQDLALDQITRLYGRLLREGRVDGGGGLSPTSVRRIHAMIRKACNDAVRWGLLRRNPVTLADPPLARAADRARRRSMQTWSPEQLRTFLATTEGDELHCMWLRAAMTGLRWSELAGLKWDSVDIERRLLTVRTTVVPVAAGEYGLEDAQKSMTSARSIHVDGRTAAAVAKQRDELQALRRSLGRAWNRDGVVFPTVEGAWRLPGSISATSAPHRPRRTGPTDPAPRPAPHARAASSSSRHQPEGHFRAPRPLVGRVRPRHLRARDAGHAAGGGREAGRPRLGRRRPTRGARRMSHDRVVPTKIAAVIRAGASCPRRSRRWPMSSLEIELID